MSKSNPFADWSEADAQKHNARVAGRTWHALENVEATKRHNEQMRQMKLKPSSDVEKLNKTEKAYHEFLKSGGYQWVGVQCITLKLAHDCRLTVDFVRIDPDGTLVFIDVKGFQREDALIKMKVAARMYPWIRFQIVKKDKGGWSHAEVKP